MKKNKSIFKCWKLVWHIKIGFFIGVQNQKNEKNVEKTQKNCKISVARGVISESDIFGRKKKKRKKKRQYLETKIQKSGTDIFKFLGGKGYEQ